jgi:hypothetical protein
MLLERELGPTLLNSEEGSRKFLRNVRINMQHYTASKSRKLQSEQQTLISSLAVPVIEGHYFI